VPIYEYKAIGDISCKLCKDRFEVRQGINDEPLSRCPKCGAEVGRLFSRPFLCRRESLSEEGTFDRYAEEEADELGLEGGFAEDEIWE
jgi:putative FmdB family regulatory protein